MTLDPPYGCRQPSENRPPRGLIVNDKAKAFNATPYSILASCPVTKIDDSGFTQFRRLSWYCLQKGITRRVGTTFIKKKWLACIKKSNVLWVAENCPDEIQEYLRKKQKVS